MDMENIFYMNDFHLKDLEDVTDTLTFSTEPSIFSTFEEEVTETCLLLMEELMMENPSLISDPDFREWLEEEIEELFFIQLEETFQWMNLEEEEETLQDLLDFSFELFFSIFIPERSCFQNDFLNHSSVVSKDIPSLLKKIQYLKSKPQPVQRTKEWYEFRYQLITASNAYKAFESQAMQNQLIYEKCLPLKTGETDLKQNPMVNTNSTLHWGQKYEPLSVMIYEEMYHTKVEDFGCIQHEKYYFIGASPDGINTDPLSDRFGRMLEIKNIVNREINGIPKKEYWIQMQLQMEVCDLEECDFLETKFIEYENAESFFHDTETDISSLKKGIILYFNTKDSKPYYVYKPLSIVTKEKIEEWEEKMVDKYESEPYSMMFIKNIYWKLEKISCILVQRNKNWFETNIGQLENIWKIIEKERIAGYEHRAPNKRNNWKTPKEMHQTIPFFFKKEGEKEFESGCLIDVNKIRIRKESFEIIHKLDFQEDFKEEEEEETKIEYIEPMENKNNNNLIKIIHLDLDLDLHLKNKENNGGESFN